MKKVFGFLLLTIFSVSLFAQGIQKPAKWSASIRKISNHEAELLLTASIDDPWIVYSVNVPEDGPMPISVTLTPSNLYEPKGNLTEITKPKEKQDAMFGMAVKYFASTVKLSQRIALEKGVQGSITIKGNVEYQCCNDKECLLLDDDFAVDLVIYTQPEQVKAPELTPAPMPVITQPEVPAPVTEKAPESDEEGSLLTFFLMALGEGLLSILTPCVFPMLPMTISFFMRGHNRRKGIRKAIVFGASIVFIFTLIGAIATISRSTGAAENISQHWLTNFIFAALFITFAISFFGAFEIRFPTKFANRIDKRADKGGYVGTFFMALAFIIISFSCTGAFVGHLLVSAAQGAVIKPLVGMFGFGLAFATPFTVLALFPSAMKKLPKSGGWMNTIKVVFAFILVLFSVKYLSNADDSLSSINIMSRELFICIWVVLFVLLGMYFLGKLRFAHDDKVDHISIPRFTFATISLCFALYLFSGLMGNPLNSLAGFLPQNSVIKSTSHAGISGTDNVNSSASAEAKAMLCNSTPKHSELDLHGPAHLPSFFDLKEAQACAKQQGKRVLIDFKGRTCSNCKKMDGEVFVDQKVLDVLKEKYVIVALYLDDKTELPVGEWYTSSFDGKVKKTIGEQNKDYLITTYNVNAMPYFVTLDSDGKQIGKPVGYTSSSEKFLEFLGAN